MQQETNNQVGSSNVNYADAGVLHYRLDTGKVLDSVENFLRARTQMVVENEGNITVQTIETEGAQPLLNNLGVQAVLCRLNLIFNSQVVQGNWKREEFWRFIGNTRRSLALLLMENKHKYGIEDTATYHLIVDGLIECLTGVLSRLIDNEERKSYGSSLVKVAETVRQGRGGLSWRNPQAGGA